MRNHNCMRLEFVRRCFSTKLRTIFPAHGSGHFWPTTCRQASLSMTTPPAPLNTAPLDTAPLDTAPSNLRVNDSVAPNAIPAALAPPEPSSRLPGWPRGGPIRTAPTPSLTPAPSVGPDSAGVARIGDDCLASNEVTSRTHPSLTPPASNEVTSRTPQFHSPRRK